MSAGDSSDIDAFAGFIDSCQAQMLARFKELDPALRIRRDPWSSTEGKGLSIALDGEGLIEKGGINISHVQGQRLPPAALERRPPGADQGFRALGLSVVMHPGNPFCPTAHANLRLFETAGDWWFGGGMDLTPCYPFDEDCLLWHEAAREACNSLSPPTYKKYKDWCDRYFRLPHRDEGRGIGGIFFDDLREPGFDRCFAFVRAVAEAFLSAYSAILERRRNHEYGERERDFQLYRRGRYVEFNLICDRGTLFGLQFGGRTEAVLMSLPAEARWRYDWQPEPGSAEARLADYLQPRVWLEDE